jgi:hypothetical protein
MASSTAATLQLRTCWQDPLFSDITVKIIEEEESSNTASCTTSDPASQNTNEEDLGRKKKRLRITQTPAVPKYSVHTTKLLLACASEYFKAELTSFVNKEAPEIAIVVEQGQADAAYAVLEAFYKGVPQDATPAQLIAMWQVADRIQANNAHLYIESLCKMALDWDTVLLVCFSFLGIWALC